MLRSTYDMYGASARKEIRTTMYSRFFFLHAYSHEYVDVDAVHSLDA